MTRSQPGPQPIRNHRLYPSPTSAAARAISPASEVVPEQPGPGPDGVVDHDAPGLQTGEDRPVVFP